jgi:hypothetical protein
VLQGKNGAASKCKHQHDESDRGRVSTPASASGLARSAVNLLAPMAPGASTRFAPLVHMTSLTKSVRQLAAMVGGVFGRIAAVIIGFVMIGLGLGLTATVVMLPVGLILGLLGVAMIVAAIFAPNDPTGRLGDR